MVRIKSNGHAMRNEVARRVQTEIDPYLVEVSLHGARAETHDRQTRVEGSFERLVANLCEMQTVGLRLKLNATLTSWNEDEVEGMFSLADAMGIPLSFDPVVTPRDDGGREPLSIAASLDGVRRLYRLVEARGAKELDPNQDASTLGAGSKKNCGTGSATVAIDPFGNVYPCVQWRRSVGNLHRQSFKDIWGKSKSLEQVRALNARAGRLVDELGPRARDAGFCLGLAEELTGDPLTLYPEVERNLQVLEELETEKTAILLPVYGQR
jgi:MoaA/NifB/PqqE/SkfB family radical SAM enzyme